MQIIEQEIDSYGFSGGTTVIDRIYRCNLCHATYDKEDLVAIRWERLNTGKDELVRAKQNFSEVENHICIDCIEDIKKL